MQTASDPFRNAFHAALLLPAMTFAFIHEGYLAWFQDLVWWQALLVIAAVIIGVVLVGRIVKFAFKVAIIVIAVIVVWQTGLIAAAMSFV